MKRAFHSIFTIILTYCIGFSQSHSYQLNPDKSINQYIIKHWSTNNNLPTNSVLHALQSSEGYMWITSYSGIIRFDGNTFTTYNKSNTQNLVSDNIGRIAEDRNGNLWFTSQENGLIKYSNNNFDTYGIEQGIKNFYRAIHIDEENKIWLASPDKGWMFLDNNEFNYIESELNLANIEVRCINRNKSGKTYFGTLGNGLFEYSDYKLKNILNKDGLPSDWIYAIHFDENDNMFLGTSKGIYEYNNSEFININPDIKSTVNAIVEDNYNNLWIATINGLFKINKNTYHSEHLTTEFGLHHNFINDLNFDLEGNLWLANYKGGLSQIKDGKFTNYTQKTGLNGKVVNAVCELSEKKYLIAFDNGKLNIVENGIVKPFNINSNIEGKRVRHILKDSQGNLWFSTYSGLLKLKKDNTEYWYNAKNRFPDNKIRVCFEDSKGKIWVGTRNNGIVIIDNKADYTHINKDQGLSANLIMCIDEDKEGNILVGTNEGGLNIIKDEKIVKIIDESAGLASNVVFNIYNDNNNITWLAVNGELVAIKNNEIFHFTLEHGLADDAPYDVLEDHSGHLWLPCSKGIMKIKKSELFHIIHENFDSLNCRLLNNNDGMFQSECNPTSQSVLGSDGSLLFPTIAGVAVIHPSNFTINKVKPPVIIENLIIDGENTPLNSVVKVAPGKKRFTFEYTALSLHEPKRIKFKYRLQGFDNNWVDADNTRSISYTNLAPGHYIFQVIACNNDGVWNEQGDSLILVIKPKFIQTKSFYGILFFIVFIIIYFFYRIRLSQLKRQQKALENKVQIRTSELKSKNIELEEQKAETLKQSEKLLAQKIELEEANSSKDKMFSIIAHDLRGPMGNFKAMLERLAKFPENYDEDKRQSLLQKLSQTASSTFDLLENLLSWSRSQTGTMGYDPERLNASMVTSEVIKLAQIIADKKHIKISLSINEEIYVYADRNMIKTILRNLITNAIKFTPEHGSIEVYTSQKNGLIEFGIKDNGVGIVNEIKENLFINPGIYSSLGTNNEKGSGLGLLLCKEFIEIQGGEMRIESEIGVGSTIYFTLKAVL